MIQVRSLPAVEPDRNNRWELVFWMGDPCDHATPFRGALAEMAEVLASQAPSFIRLPDYEDSEDFVEGSLQFGGTTVYIYYEHCLGYLSLTSPSETILREIASHLDTRLKLV
jgi:hypothetical protein